MDLLLRIVLVDPLDHHLHTLCLRSVFAVNTRSAIPSCFPRVDWLTLKLAKKNKGARLPTMRLWLTYPAATPSAIGLILLGISINRVCHWIVGQVDSFLFSAGIQMENSDRKLYCRLLSLAVNVNSHLYAVALNLSAFTNPFFITPWVSSEGYTWTFAVQGIITFWFCVPALVCIHRFGPKLRAWATWVGESGV
jgi:hypothetical protein